MKDAFLIITSIAGSDHPVLKTYAEQSAVQNISFIVVGDLKTPETFSLAGCDYYSKERQDSLAFELVKNLPVNHYSRKNIGYLTAMSKGAEIIIETDDDNFPMESFWNERKVDFVLPMIQEKGWVNVYKYFSEQLIWPRGFSLEHLRDTVPALEKETSVHCPIQQGLVDNNPDVDAIFRLVMSLPFNFQQSSPVTLGKNTFCPFNSQNTTWFKEAFPLLYLPSFCSFRMTDIWRSFVAQRIAWTCGWSILFHSSTALQERNNHRLLQDFIDESPGFHNNDRIIQALQSLPLLEGKACIAQNMVLCYQELIRMNLVGSAEMPLLLAWLNDVNRT